MLSLSDKANLGKHLSLMDAGGEKKFSEFVEMLKVDRHSYAGFHLDKNTKYFVKCYRPKNIVDRFLVACKLTRSFKAYRAAGRLAKYNCTPEAYTLVVNRKSSNVYVFYKAIPGSNLSERYKQGLDSEDVTGLMASCGSLLSRLHLLGWSHGDFKWANIRLGKGLSQPCIVDLDGVKPLRLNANSKKGRDLARFIVNAEDFDVDEAFINEFVNAYAQASHSSVEQVIDMSRSSLKKLRRRHDLKYGPRKKKLFE